MFPYLDDVIQAQTFHLAISERTTKALISLDFHTHLKMLSFFFLFFFSNRSYDQKRNEPEGIKPQLQSGPNLQASTISLRAHGQRLIILQPPNPKIEKIDNEQ